MRNQIKKSPGFTLIELMVAMSVLAIALGFAVSSFGAMLERQRLQGAAESLYDMLLVARSESINRYGNIYVSIATGAGWCHGIDDTAACNCGTANDCQVDGSAKVTSSIDSKTITLSSATTTQFRYNYQRGMPETTTGLGLSASTFTFTSSAGETLSVELSPVGRLRLCTSGTFRGYPAC